MLRWIKDVRRRYDARRRPDRWYLTTEPVAPVEPPVAFIAPPPMPEAELEALRLRPHP